MTRHLISSNWLFGEATGADRHSAAVPGCVHTDLLNHGLIPDPYLGTNEQTLQWIGEKDWIYQVTFDLPRNVLNEVNIDLVFYGLDTYAEVTLNNAPILRADNMFREWRIASKALLKELGNTLSVRFRNVFAENLPKYQGAPYRLQAYGNNDQADVKIAMYSRKAQFHYGWDWGPRLVTCGIWRPVVVEAWSGARIKSVFVQPQNVTAEAAEIVSVFEVVSDSAQRVTLTASMDDVALLSGEHSVQPGLNRITVHGRLVKPALWWTNGLGEPRLYEYKARLESGGGGMDECAARIGVRSLEIMRDRDADGVSFYVRLNGVPVFMKGANYIPQDNFQNRVTRERYEHILRSAAAAHMNMLRVWGGGIYEENVFYDLCDELGILVWHDLQFACAMYPADASFLKSVRCEIIDNVCRIRNHACLALYCGNNENEMSWHVAPWKDLFPPEVQEQFEAAYRALFCECIPKTLKETDPTRYYHSTSPSAGFNHVPYGDGDIHYWGVWHGKEPFEEYLGHIARFVSEYGFQSYPELSTVKKYAEPGALSLGSETMLSHQRCQADERRDKEYGNRLIRHYMDQWYRTPRDFESYLYVSQVMQAEGVRMGLEAHRRAMPYCMGSLFWQIDDCWPVASWSSIDYFGRWKALHYAARRSFAPILLSPVLKPDETQFYIVSDMLQPVPAMLEIRVLDFVGNEISRESIAVIVQPNSSACYTTLTRRRLNGGRDESRLVIVARLLEGKRVIAENLSYFLPPKALNLSPPEIRMRIVPRQDRYDIEVASRTLARNVMLSCGDDPGFFSDNHFDLLAGEPVRLDFKTTLDIESVRRDLKATSLVDSY